jgi:Flp pilus assembly protein TadB
MNDEIFSQIVNAFIVISGVCVAFFVGSVILFLPLEIVAGVFLVAVAIAVAIFAIRKQERSYQKLAT